MRQLFSSMALLLSVVSLLAQNITLTFSGRDVDNQFVPLQKVVITDITQNWQDTIDDPGTIVLMSSTSIEDLEKAKTFSLSQNIPNPFDGVSDCCLSLPKGGKVSIEVIGLNGRKIADYNNRLPAGIHTFRVLLNTPQSYVVTARCEKESSSIKIVNKGNAGVNALLYLGEGERYANISQLKSDKGQSTHIFNIGDEMSYVGYAVVDGVDYVSDTVQQQQIVSENIILHFIMAPMALPEVSTENVSSITDSSAVLDGNVISDGGATITARGVCWSTSPNPTIDDSCTLDSMGVGSFTSTITGLSEETTYYVCAYATNSVGTAYGNQLCFTTLSSFICGTSTITDHEGNVYNTVKIGEQCWTKENMRCTTSPSTGTMILETNWRPESFAGKKAYYVDGSAANTSTYGLLYNWNAAVDTFNIEYGEYDTSYSDIDCAVEVTFSGPRRGICPPGWHVPSYAEWDTLFSYVGSQSAFQCNSNSSNIAKALASTMGWVSNSTNTCVVGYNPSTNNATNFTAVPTGYRLNSFAYFGKAAMFWSADQYHSYSAYGPLLFNYYADVRWSHTNKSLCAAIRCLRN